MHSEKVISHPDWSHVPIGRQECLCACAIILVSSIGAALAIWLVLTEQVF